MVAVVLTYNVVDYTVVRIVLEWVRKAIQVLDQAAEEAERLIRIASIPTTRIDKPCRVLIRPTPEGAFRVVLLEQIHAQERPNLRRPLLVDAGRERREPRERWTGL